MCTLEKVVVYLYTAFFEFPPSQEWTRVYLWASNRMMQAHGKLPAGQTVWDMIGDVELGRQELRLPKHGSEHMVRIGHRGALATARKYGYTFLFHPARA